VLEIDNRFSAPDGFPKRRSCDERARLVGQHHQYLEWLRCELEHHTASRQDMIGGIEIELPESP
jgi:hypothetical protein